jgi:hypothetical protein
VQVLFSQTHGVSLNAQNGRTAPEHAQAVLPILRIEHLPAGERHDADLLALLLENTCRSNSNGDLAPGADDREVLAFPTLVQDVSAPSGLLNACVLQMGEVLPGEGQDGGRAARLDRDEVRRGRLVPVGWSPEMQVGQSAQVDGGFDGLVGRPVLAEPDRVMRRDPDDLMTTQSGKTDGACGIGDKVLRDIVSPHWPRSIASGQELTKKVPPKGMMPPYAAKPFIIAPMACSRTP